MFVFGVEQFHTRRWRRCSTSCCAGSWLSAPSGASGRRKKWLEEGSRDEEGRLPPPIACSWVGSLLRTRTGKTGLPGFREGRAKLSHVSGVVGGRWRSPGGCAPTPARSVGRALRGQPGATTGGPTWAADPGGGAAGAGGSTLSGFLIEGYQGWSLMRPWHTTLHQPSVIHGPEAPASRGSLLQAAFQALPQAYWFAVYSLTRSLGDF